ncbi:MAG: hypothetical protein ACXVH1_35060 [Solirubrobacteraceae bacterium]
MPLTWVSAPDGSLLATANEVAPGTVSVFSVGSDDALTQVNGFSSRARPS